MPLTPILLLAAALRLWRLQQNGYANEYYSAAVRSMASSWHNFLYTAFDPAGFVSVDKPPLALWLQVASVKLFGFHPLAILVPQALMGVASVWLVHHLVRRSFGGPAGLLAALFLALTPVSVAVDRSSNTESCLLLILLLAAWAILRAAENGRRRDLLLSLALVGVAFNVKMLAAFVVLPVFALVHLLGRPVRPLRMVVDGVLGALVLAAVSASWIAVYDLTPSTRRPYAGTTDSNLIAELAVGPYGVGRFVKQVRPAVAAETDRDGGEPTATRRSSEAGPRTGFARLFVRVPVGPLRLADGQMAAQASWLAPLALVGAALGVSRRGLRLPLAPPQLALILWLGWALTYAIVFSWAGGIMHFYYLVMLAPPLAALAGIGAVRLWERSMAGGRWAVLPPIALVVTAAWQLRIDADALGGPGDLLGPSLAFGQPWGGWRTWLHAAVASAALVAAGVLLAAVGRPPRRVAAAAAVPGLASVLVLPAAWALSSVLVAGPGVLPAADLARLMVPEEARARSWTGDTANIDQLVTFLRANRGDTRYLLVTSSATLASPIIVRTGEPVMARGGFHGLDPILTREKLARLVEAREVRFVMLNDLSTVSRRLGGEAAGRSIADWVRASGRLVDPALWRASRRTTMTLYDLRPDLPLTAAR